MKVQPEQAVRASLASYIQQRRKQKGWTQQVLAERSQLPRSYVADLEGARRNPSLRSLVRISNALGIAIHELFLEPSAK